MSRVTIKRCRPEGGRLHLHNTWDVNVNGERVGSVAPIRRGWGPAAPIVGWYYVVVEMKLGIPHRNTCGEIGLSEEDAKAAAVAYVKECLRSAKAIPGGEK